MNLRVQNVSRAEQFKEADSYVVKKSLDTPAKGLINHKQTAEFYFIKYEGYL
jgi:hypothetical protein